MRNNFNHNLWLCKLKIAPFNCAVEPKRRNRKIQNPKTERDKTEEEKRMDGRETLFFKVREIE
jgi:hypothetical protein